MPPRSVITENGRAGRPPAGILVISPHLDDGVFSCGRLLADSPGSYVLTVFAGNPPSALGLTDWDHACGFASSEDAMVSRRAEDDRAMAILGARPVRLAYRDSQYCEAGDGPEVADIAREIAQVVCELEPRAVFLPLGLFHSDHRLAHDGAMQTRREITEQLREMGKLRTEWFVYADALYRTIPELLARRLDELQAELQVQGVASSPVEFDVGADASEKKEAAAACYRSQHRGLATPGRLGMDDVARPETYWRLDDA